MVLKFKGKESFLFISLFSLLLMCILFFLHERSVSSIRELQNGNELAGRTFQINNTLQEIVSNINTVETVFRNSASKNNQGGFAEANDAITKMNSNVVLINELTKNGSYKDIVSRLSLLIKNKTIFFKTISTDLSNKRQLLVSAENNSLNDSIYITALSVQIQAESELQKKITQNFVVAKQALSLSKVLTLLAMGAILLLGTIIILRLLHNNRLIKALELSKQQADNAANIKEQFLANMSHEIRTPVNSIIGFTNVLQKTSLQADQEQFVGYIKNSGENLLHIVNDILDISKIEAGMLHFQKEPFNIQELCYYIEMMFYNEAKLKNIDFNYSIEKDVPAIIIGDEDRLKQILTNLIGNAFKFTHEGLINLSISVTNKTKKSVHLIFKVSDTGIGIAKENLLAIFERFVQSESNTTKTYGGTGLGLNIVKKLVNMQGGHISIESELGKSSVFTFNMPAQLYPDGYLQANTINPITENASVEINFANGYKILAVEDNKMNQLLLQYIFKQWNLNYTLAENGADAIEILKNEKFNLVLMDIQMPVMDGYTTANWIRNELKSAIPIIAMTAFVLQSEKDKCFAFGMNEYLPKPINEIKLKQLIAKYITTNTPVAEASYVSVKYLTEIFSGNNIFVTNILQLFIKQYPQEVALLHNTILNKDIKKTKALAHNLKSTVSSINDKSPLINHLQKLEELSLEEPDWYKANTEIDMLKEIIPQIIMEANKALESIA